MNMIDKIKQLFVILFQFPIKSFILVRGKKIYQIKGYTCLKTVVERNKETIPYNKRERERGRKSRRQAKKIQAGSDIHDHGLHERIIRWIGAGLVTRVSNFD